MDTFQIALIVSMVVGIALIAYSIYLYSTATGEKDSNSGYFETANTLKYLETSIDEIDKTMDELHDTSKHIFEEMENKYKDLLLLYSLIEDKKKELAGIYSTKPTDYKPGETLAASAEEPAAAPKQAAAAPEQAEETAAADEAPANALSSPNIRKVRQMQEEGLSLEDTAKKLGIGKGEVKLMLDLGKIK
ncbi:MAG: hypothetical protein FWD98_04310 [Defluviitaleaceae bacterium]|nr:hypothetical protein [Defluviitaleaceae bacterium]